MSTHLYSGPSTIYVWEEEVLQNMAHKVVFAFACPLGTDDGVLMMDDGL